MGLLDVDCPAVLLGVVPHENLIDVAVKFPRGIVGDVEQFDGCRGIGAGDGITRATVAATGSRDDRKTEGNESEQARHGAMTPWFRPYREPMQSPCQSQRR